MSCFYYGTSIDPSQVQKRVWNGNVRPHCPKWMKTMCKWSRRACVNSVGSHFKWSLFLSPRHSQIDRGGSVYWSTTRPEEERPSWMGPFYCLRLRFIGWKVQKYVICMGVCKCANRSFGLNYSPPLHPNSMKFLIKPGFCVLSDARHCVVSWK